MLPRNQKVVSQERFDGLFRQQALIAEFPTKGEEAEYVRRDSFLIHLIRRETERQFGSESDRAPFVGDDWWPDHARHLVIMPEHCTPAFLEALRGLLSDDYLDYRIQLCVYADYLDGKTYFGSMALSANSVLIEQKLHDLLNSKRNA